MIVLIVVGFLAGVVTGISPCILPVVPVIFAAGATGALPADTRRAPTTSDEAGRSGDPVVPEARVPVGVAAGGSVEGPAGPSTGGAPDDPVPSACVVPDPHRSDGPGGGDVPEDPGWDRAERRRLRRRPFAVVGGLVLSFSLATLIGSALLSFFGLPQDLLRNLGILVLAVVALGLIVPPFGDLLERPFARLVRGRQHNDAGGFVLGLSLGLLFVPCAGPVLTAITVVGADHRIGFSAVLLTAAFACGVAVPLLVFAIAGQRIVGAMPALRNRAVLVRRIVGVLLVVTAVVIALGLTDGIQRAVPGYTTALQNRIEANSTAKQALDQVSTNTATGALANCINDTGSSTLLHCGPAPAFKGVTAWLNTPGGSPLTIASLKGKVVLVDFWTYSCINCQRSLPHVEAWYSDYAADGFVVVGVHTPEFAFEHVTSNVAAAAGQLGVHYPIAVDDNYDTWNNYQNNYWPAEYLIDATGQVRHLDTGEGDYSQTEGFIRQLLVAAHPTVHLPTATDVPDRTPNGEQTPETYLGYGFPEARGAYGENTVDDQPATYVLPSSIAPNSYSLGGQWTVGPEDVLAGDDATLTLEFQADDVYLVLGGQGTVDVAVDGKPGKVVTVTGIPRLYTLFSSPTTHTGSLTLRMTPGVQAYDFTFG